MRLFPQELLIRKLQGKPIAQEIEWLDQMSNEQCVARLEALSGQSFGHDADAWARWWEDEQRRADRSPHREGSDGSSV